ncbi:hypothetical protein GCM10009107_24230 [Ideonella azotifigens]|uniref:Polysaccharide biosynthesis protein n=2 Tax=Ideonella azotifigens TaxID=513160 RepID=A0ABP3V9Z1_9BURK
MFRSWTILAGAATMVLLPLWLTPTQQGYYYTFASILALQVFFELGFNQIVVQLVSHEVAHLEIDAEGALRGEAVHLDRLGSLARLMRRWYAVAACLFVALGGLAGITFFSHKGVLPPSSWLGAWLLLTCASAVNLYLSPGLAMMEGAGRVGQVARLRLVQSCIGYLCLWSALYLDAGLWATAAAPLVGASGTGWWLRKRGDMLRRVALREVPQAHRLLWRRDVFPFQWRIALSWVSGYFIFNMFTPLVFSRVGPVEAGRLGLALTMFNAVSTIGMSWINARNPQFTMHISRGERAALNALFGNVLLRSCVATALLSTLVAGGAALLAVAGVPAMARIASPAVLACLAWATVVNSVVFGAAAFMRAHREEPMLPVSIVTAVLTAAAAWFGSRVGVLPMMLLYAVVPTFVTLPWTLMLLSRYLKRTA